MLFSHSSRSCFSFVPFVILVSVFRFCVSRFPFFHTLIASSSISMLPPSAIHSYFSCLFLFHFLPLCCCFLSLAAFLYLLLLLFLVCCLLAPFLLYLSLFPYPFLSPVYLLIALFFVLSPFLCALLYSVCCLYFISSLSLYIFCLSTLIFSIPSRLSNHLASSRLYPVTLVLFPLHQYYHLPLSFISFVSSLSLLSTGMAYFFLFLLFVLIVVLCFACSFFPFVCLSYLYLSLSFFSYLFLSCRSRWLLSLAYMISVFVFPSCVANAFVFVFRVPLLYFLFSFLCVVLAACSLLSPYLVSFVFLV